MATTITIPQEYGYVLLTAAATFFVGQWHGLRIASFRKPAGIGYPKVFADTAEMSAASPEKQQAMYLFNCAQRAHGNYLENMPSTVFSLLLAGLKYPIASSVLGVIWLTGRIIYAVGYTRSDKTNGSGRLLGSHYFIAQMGLFGLTVWSGIKMIM